MNARGTTWLGRCLQLTLLLALPSGGCSEEGPSMEAFAAYWADTGELCTWLEECRMKAKAECLEESPRKDEVLAAIAAGGFTDAEINRCEQASRALDTCQLVLTCEQAAAMPDPCETPQQAFNTQCQPLMAQIALETDKRP